MDIKQLTHDVEKVSRQYAERWSIERDADWFLLKLHEEVGELTQAYLMLTGKARPKGKSSAEIQADFSREVADVLCHTLLLAQHHGVDLEKEIAQKWLARIQQQ